MYTFIYICITLFFIGLSFTVNFFGKKIKNNYWFWSIPSLFFLIWFIVFRFYDAWKDLNQYLETYGSIWMRDNPSYDSSITISKALLLDMCPFMALALPFSLIVDKTRRIAQAIAPFAILGGGISIIFITFSDSSYELSFKYIFIGNSQPIYFFMHFYLIVFGTMVMSNSINRKWTNLIDCHLFAIFYFGYVCFVAYTTNTTFNVTGVNANDWMSIFGEYREVSSVFNLGWPYVMIVAFLLAYLFIFIITSVNIFWKKRCQSKIIKSKYLKQSRKQIQKHFFKC